MIQVPDIIKEYLHFDTCQKNIRIHFPNGERSDICNDLIVKDTVSFTESLCSQDTLKFGLCEAPVFECETVGVGNIKGATIQVFCEIYCEAAYANVPGAIWQSDLMAHVYQIPLGTFVVASCQRQGDIIHRKIVAYGGPAAFDWSFPEYELNKMVSTSTAPSLYDPKLFYLLNECGVKFSDEYFDIEDIAIVTQTRVIWIDVNVVGKDGREKRISLRPYYTKQNNVTSQALYCYKHSGITNEEAFISMASNIFDQDVTVELADELYRGGSGILSSSPLIPNRLYMEYGGTYFQDCCRFQMPNELILYPYITSNKAMIAQIYIGFEINIYDGSYLVAAFTTNSFVDLSLKKKVLKSTYSALGDYSAYPITWKLFYSHSRLGDYSRPDYTEYNFQDDVNSWLERMGYFGYFGRDGAFKILNLKRQFALLPSNTLYPEYSLYPGGPTGSSIKKEDYQSCWYDDEYTKPFGVVQCTYTNSNNENCIYVLYLPGFDGDTDTSSYNIYDFSDNTLAQSKLWTETDVANFCDLIANAIDGVQYMPVSFTGRGLPYVEAGDTFEILTKANESITTIVLNRTLTGDQTLTDSYKSTGTDTGIY